MPMLHSLLEVSFPVHVLSFIVSAWLVGTYTISVPHSSGKPGVEPDGPRAGQRWHRGCNVV